jgi:hypothetical protein
MHGTIPPLPNTSSWRGAYLSKGQLYLYLYLVRHCFYRTYFSRTWKGGTEVYHTVARVEAFTTIMFQVEVFWIVTPCGVVVGYLRRDTACISETLICYHNTIWRHNPKGLD